MTCPQCGGEMVPGSASVRGTALGFMVFGLSYQHLWFRRQGGSKDERIINSLQTKHGQQCTKCGSIFIQHFGNSGAENSFRKWTLQASNASTIAQLLSDDGTSVVLGKQDGSTYQLPRTELSIDDIAYLDELKKD